MLKKSLAAGILAATMGIAAPASAGVIQLGFILDESGSIGSANYTIIKNGLAQAIGSYVPLDGTYEISVVSFSTAAQTLVDKVLLTGANLAAVQGAITGDTYGGGVTAMNLAFDQMKSVLSTTTNAIDFTYVNFATDGVANTSGMNAAQSDAAAIASRDAMIAAAGVDNLSVEGIGGGIDAAWLQTQICFPQACDTTSPYNFPNQGFYIGVANAQGYADAIGNKIQVVTGVPEPMTVSLVGLGLVGLALRRRRAA